MKETAEPTSYPIPESNPFQGTGLEMLRASILLIPVPASVVDLESNRIVALNPQFAQSLRLPLETILDRTPDELGFRPNDDDRKAVLTGTVNGGIHHTHRRTKLPDGNWVEYTDSSRRILVDGKECLLSCYEPASRLVSEAETSRKAKEAELLESEERLRLVLDATSDGVFDWDIATGMVYFSPAYYTMLGYEPYGFPSNFDAWRDHLHPDDLVVVEKALQAHFSNPDRLPYLVEFRMKHKENDWIWIQAKGKVVGSDANGKPVRMVGTHTDITQRKRQDDALREREEQLRIVADMSLDMLSRHDLSGVCTWASPSCRQILHIEPDAVVGRSAFDFIYEDWHRPVQEALAQLMENGRSSLEYRIRRTDGTGIWVETLWNLSRDAQGTPLEILCSTRDISDRQQAQEEIKALNGGLEKKVQERTAELQAAMKEMESFSYSISHDLRSPLRAIDGFSQALVEDAGSSLPQELQMYLGRIRAASQHMGRLIDDLLQLSRSTRAEIVRTEIDISAMTSQILDDFCRQSPDRRLIRKVESPISIRGDSVLVRSVMENLLGNAWKYSSFKAESVIELTSHVDAGRRWIRIQDNGIGFDMAHADKLFGTFHRLHSLEKFEGTGIGLATVRKIVERHGGSVRAHAVVDQGATFQFTLDPTPGVVS